MKKMSFTDNALYYVMCILTLGTVWLFRVIITKAILEANKK